MSIQLMRGTNISHWLSQSKERGANRAAYFTQEDVRRLADWGFDHLRIPIDEEQMWDVSGRQQKDAFTLLENVLDWLDDAGMNAIVDLHILRSHFFNQTTEPRLFTDPAEAEKFAGFWRELSAFLKHRPNDRVAYELMNEPVAHDARNWNRVAKIAHAAIRELEPERPVILGSNRWNSVFTYDLLDIPDDSNLILTFHYYLPMFLTHHCAPWCREGQIYSGPIQYPGKPVSDAELAKLPPDVRKEVEVFNTYYDRGVMVKDLAKPLAAARRTGLPLYCGEFGAIDLAPQELRVAWFRDIISVFREHNIGWANWDYKAEFGILRPDGSSTGLAEVMLRTPELVRI